LETVVILPMVSMSLGSCHLVGAAALAGEEAMEVAEVVMEVLAEVGGKRAMETTVANQALMTSTGGAMACRDPLSPVARVDSLVALADFRRAACLRAPTCRAAMALAMDTHPWAEVPRARLALAWLSARAALRMRA